MSGRPRATPGSAAGGPAGGAGGRLRFMLRALGHRNYRLFFAGQGTSLIGTWITRLATSWLVYRLTGSAAMLGIVGFAGQIPTFVVPIYVQQGILPEIAAGLSHTTALRDEVQR